MGRLEAQLKNAREKVERARIIAEKEREKKVRKLSIEYASKGATAYEGERFGDAVKALQSYIKLMEQYKNVKEHGLTPQLFNPKREMMDILLVAGVYWDLAKIYDHTRKPGMKANLKTYLQKFVVFAKGMPFQSLCAESLRKYIDNDKPKNPSEFKFAYTALTGEKRCFVAASLMDVCDHETLPRLRHFRDGWLRGRAPGRAFIGWYYRHGPGLAYWVEKLPHAVRKPLGRVLDYFARTVERCLR